MIYLYLFGTCFHFIYVFMIIGKELNVRCVWSMGKVVPGTDRLLHK